MNFGRFVFFYHPWSLPGLLPLLSQNVMNGSVAFHLKWFWTLCSFSAIFNDQHGVAFPLASMSWEVDHSPVHFLLFMNPVSSGLWTVKLLYLQRGPL